MGAKISSIAYIFPEKRVSNDDLQTLFPDYDFKQFEAKVGIRNRYIVSGTETALDLAVAVCEKLFRKIDRNKIDYILYCTQSSDYPLPTTACILQQKLDLNKNIGALDFNLGCSGYTYGLSLAKGLVGTNQAKSVLLVTAETYSKYIHTEDRSNMAIFGDAATATLIEVSATDEIGEFVFGTDGSGFEKLIVKNGGSKNSFDPTPQLLEYGSGNKYTDNNLYMDGPEVFEFTTRVIPGLIAEILQRNNILDDKIDQFIFHQANAFMLNLLRKKIGIQKERFFIDLMDGGNTVSSTIPIALAKYSSQIDSPASVVLAGFGVGLSWSGTVININNLI